VRVVEFAVKDADTGISELFALVTTLMDTEAYPAAEIARLYLERWKAELVFEILKVQVRETHATLRSKSPAMVRQELYALLCCYQAIRHVIARAAHTARIDPRDIRFPEALDAVRQSVATVLSPR
jgi:IS4 transposase